MEVFPSPFNRLRSAPRFALQAILQSGLEAIDEGAGRAEAGKFERR
jgi:hypothetical protein